MAVRLEARADWTVMFVCSVAAIFFVPRRGALYIFAVGLAQVQSGFVPNGRLFLEKSTP